jgi:hypothetical protein
MWLWPYFIGSPARIDFCLSQSELQIHFLLPLNWRQVLPPFLMILVIDPSSMHGFRGALWTEGGFNVNIRCNHVKMSIERQEILENLEVRF